MTHNIDTEVLVVGAGLLGSSTAMHLASMGARSVDIVDLDLEGIFSSSELNAGGVRATWASPINAQLSRVSIDYYEKIAAEIGFRQKGYFWMYSKEAWPNAHALLKENKDLDSLRIEYLSPAEVTQRFSFLDKTDDLGGATFSPKDGLLNANLLKNHFRNRARENHARFHNRVWIHRAEVSTDQTIELCAWVWPEAMNPDEIKRILTIEQSAGECPRGAKAVKLRAQKIVNCSGAWAKRFAQSMGMRSVSQAVRRQVSVFECKEVDLTSYGMFVDASGVYFHPEANYILAGYAVPEEPEGYNFDYEGESFFEQYIWAPLFNRSTKFEALKHVTGWAGLYEVSPDRNGIVGRVAGFENVFEAHSFSGRGAMQSYGAGLGLAELIVKGKYRTLDLSAMSGSRFESGNTLTEGMLI
ncbi:MAG: FAD-binding oxidoreductase [Bdellovibrionota bacterium]